MGAAQLHPRSRQRPGRVDLEKPPRPNPHADYDRLVRSRGMGPRLPNLLQVKHPLTLAHIHTDLRMALPLKYTDTRASKILWRSCLLAILGSLQTKVSRESLFFFQE